MLVTVTGLMGGLCSGHGRGIRKTLVVLMFLTFVGTLTIHTHRDLREVCDMAPVRVFNGLVYLLSTVVM